MNMLVINNGAKLARLRDVDLRYNTVSLLLQNSINKLLSENIEEGPTEEMITARMGEVEHIIVEEV